MRSRLGRSLVLVTALALLPAVAGATAKMTLAEPSDDELTSCDEMPELWSGSYEVAYDWDSRTAVLLWEGHDPVRISDGASCESQPGLEGFLRDLRDGERETRKTSCKDLRNLVKEVRAENPKAKGEVKVSREAEKKATRKNPAVAKKADDGSLDAKLDSGGERTIDLDQADAVLAGDCKNLG